MEKISGIVKGSSRVNNADLKNAPPVRPGAPGFGRPAGTSTSTSGSAASTAEKAVAKHKEIMDARRAAAEGSKIVRHMADKFFLQQGSTVEDEAVSDVDINLPAAKEALKPEIKTQNISEELEQITDPDLIPTGSYLNVTA